MLPANPRITRRHLLAGSIGLGAAYLLGTSRQRAAARTHDPHLAWAWEFARDGAPDEIGRRLLQANLGLVFKTHDGPRWMSQFDESPYAVTGSAQVSVLAAYYESAGIPFHAWAVLQGSDPESEAHMAFEVLASGARTLYLDPGPESESWRGDAEAAQRFGHELRRLLPGANVILTLDGRPWLYEGLPLADLAAFCNGIAVKELWTSYNSPEDREEFDRLGFSPGDEAVTPELVHEAAVSSLRHLKLPFEFIGDGTTEDAGEFERFLESCKASGSSFAGVWRVGTMSEQVHSLLKDAPELQPKPPAEVVRRVHVVEAGETLTGIAARYDVSASALVEANDLDDPDFLAPGQELYIP